LGAGARLANAVVCGLIAAAAAPAHAASAGSKTELARPFVPSISIERNERSDVPAEAIGRSRQRGARASGVVRCGGAIGTGQLTLRADLVTTAAHVLIGPGGGLRSGTCTFEPAGGRPVQIDAQSIRAGSRQPLAEPAARDWAVARLVAPVAGAAPYGLGPLSSFPARVTMYAGGHGRADGLALEPCSAHHVIGTSAQGIREVAIDCSAAPGASGAALLDGQQRAVAIYVGFRSANPDRPQPFSRTHYNFAISIDGPFRRALLAAAAGAR